VDEVQIDGLALLKLVKHCRDSLPKMVAGSLLGLDQGSILEVTHCFPFPTPKSREDYGDGLEVGDGSDDLDGEEYQMEMMKMLREVNVDNNCVGWYKSIYVGSFCQTPLVETQFSYQENLSDNCVVLLYDPIEGGRGVMNLKAYQLSEQFITSYRAKSNAFVAPSSILVELPLKVKNPGLITAFLYDLHVSGQLKKQYPVNDLNPNDSVPLEHYLEHCCQWVDDLVEEQSKFQYYLRNVERQKDQLRWHNKRKAEVEQDDADSLTWKNTTQPPRLDSLLIANQIHQYCTQINAHSTCALSKLHLSGILSKFA